MRFRSSQSLQPKAADPQEEHDLLPRQLGVKPVVSFNEWLRERIDDADALSLNEIVVPVSPENGLGIIDLLRAWHGRS